MKKILVLLVLFTGLVYGLFAQVTASDYSYIQAGHIGTDHNETLDTASLFAKRMFENSASSARKNGFTHRVIEEKTRLEEQLVIRARDELPDRPTIGSIWIVNMGRVNAGIVIDIYSIIFFVNQDGQIYHWMQYTRNIR
jgi:hypothetical protein